LYTGDMASNRSKSSHQIARFFIHERLVLAMEAAVPVVIIPLAPGRGRAETVHV
jgi:hypothetical protein